MKKFFVGMTACALAAVMCLSFAACGKSGGSGDVDVGSVEGKEVTAEQWDAAFDELMSAESAYTVRGKITSEVPQKKGEYTASVTVEYSGTYVQDGVGEHLNGKMKYLRCSGDAVEVYGEEGAKDISNYIKQDFIVAIDTYVEKKNDGYYCYVGSGYSQMYSKSGPFDFEEADIMRRKHGFECGDIATLFKDCKGRFDRFHYDAEKKGYVLVDVKVGEEYENTVIKFNENGKLIAIFGDNAEHGFWDDREIEFHFLVEYIEEEIVFPTNFTER